jgi:molybdopterin-containing oxidoreductase family membrane subunit
LLVPAWLRSWAGIKKSAPLGHITRYTPTRPEVAIAIGIWAMGFLIITVLYKIFLSVREAAELD